MYQSQFIEMFGTLDNHPAEYAVKTLRDLSECYAGATPSTKVREYWDNGSIPWMSSGEVHMEHVTETESKITESGYQQTSTKMVPVHSVVIALAGQGKTRGKVAITEIPLCTNQSLCAIVPSKGIHYEYLYHNLKGRYLELRGMAGDVNGRGGLNLKIVQSIQVIVPPIDEQMKFVAIAQQADKSKFSGLKSQFIEMLKGKAINGTISDLVAPKIANVKKTYSHDDTIQYIDISSINAEDHSVSLVTEYSVKNAPSRAQQCVKYGDLLVSTVRPINRNIAIVDKNLDNLVASTGFCVLRPNDGMLNYLLSIVLSDDYTDAMCDKANGGVYPAVNNGDVLNYQIHIPDDDLAKRASLVRQQADKSKQIAFSRAS